MNIEKLVLSIALAMSVLPLVGADGGHASKRARAEGKSISIQDLIDTGKIPEIKDGHLDLRDKDIESLNGLKNIPGIKEISKLDLADNKISEIPGNAFAGLSNLRDLFLENNKISRINEKSFAGLPNLEYLRLYDNKLLKIEDITTVIESLKKLKEIEFLYAGGAWACQRGY